MPAHILVVDDEPDLEVLVARRFRHHIRLGEFRFLFARDGEEALELVRSAPELDMVLSDINMPRMDGLSFLHHLKSLNGQLQAVVVSAYGDMANIRSAMNAGAFDFVTKPIEFRDLEATIRKALAETALLRRLARERSLAERQRANLARYFTPTLVEHLAGADDPFGMPSQQTAAVLFVDIIGFTGLCSRHPPEPIFQLLRDFHGRMADCVFRHGGTVDKYLGDGLMASFGTPRPGVSDASNALLCALSMHEAVEAMNRCPPLDGGLALSIGVGIHHGPVWLGNIGDARRLEFAILGDTVNLASRLEDLSRPLQARVVISEALYQAVRREHGHPPEALAAFRRHSQQPIRGHQPMTVHVLGRI